MVYLGVVPTALGFATWAFALRRTSAGRMASLAYLIPVVAILLGWARARRDAAVARGRRRRAVPRRRRPRPPAGRPGRKPPTAGWGCRSFGLSRELWVVQVGIFLNMLGYGAVLPFEIIYLHDGRGFSLGVAGLVVGTITGLAVIAAPVAGALIDRVGARATAAGGGLALAAGYGGLAFAHTPRQAFAAAAAAGAGNGALLPSQSALLASLAAPELRHRATAVSRVAANVGFGLGGALGGLVAAHGLNGFVVLFCQRTDLRPLRADPRRRRARRRSAGAGRRRLPGRAARPAVHPAGADERRVIAVGWGVFSWIVPPYARGEIGVGSRLSGSCCSRTQLTVVSRADTGRKARRGPAACVAWRSPR